MSRDDYPDDNISDTERLDTIVNKFLHCKWADSGPLEDWRPEDEKYINSKDLRDAIDEQIRKARGSRRSQSH